MQWNNNGVWLPRKKEPINIKSIKKTMKKQSNNFPVEQRENVNIETFKATLREEFGYQADLVFLKGRKREIVNIRKSVMYFLKQRSTINNSIPTYEMVGSYFEKDRNGHKEVKKHNPHKDHSTVYCAIKTHFEHVEVNDLAYMEVFHKVKNAWYLAIDIADDMIEENLLKAKSFLDTPEKIDIVNYLAKNYYSAEVNKFLTNAKIVEVVLVEKHSMNL